MHMTHQCMDAYFDGGVVEAGEVLVFFLIIIL